MVEGERRRERMEGGNAKTATAEERDDVCDVTNNERVMDDYVGLSVVLVRCCSELSAGVTTEGQVVWLPHPQSACRRTR
jgi:hypothetical protein